MHRFTHPGIVASADARQALKGSTKLRSSEPWSLVAHLLVSSEHLLAFEGSGKGNDFGSKPSEGRCVSVVLLFAQ